MGKHNKYFRAFIFFFQRKHRHKLCELEGLIKSLKRKKNVKTHDALKQVSLFHSAPMKMSAPSSQQEIDDALLNWIVDGAHAFSEVERESFKALWEKLSTRNLMCSKTLVHHLSFKYEHMKSQLISELAEVQYVCATADCWSANNKAFLGVTCLYLDNSLERRSATLACKRIVGKHTYDVLAKEIFAILGSYMIQNKTLLMVTDNATNFIKAFRLFSEETEATDDFLLTNIPISNIFEEDGEDVENHLVLPPHHHCSAHTLNLVATKDSEQALQDSAFKKVSRSAFGKCQALWNKSKMSVVLADRIYSELSARLIVPNKTRWNSMHSAVDRICRFLGENEEKLHKIFDAAGLARLLPHEVEFLYEYCTVMDPLSRALNILQGEVSVSMGYLAPTIHQLLRTLKSCTDLRFCRPLVKAVVSGVEKRFGPLLWDRETVLSACFHPRFKLFWIEEKDRQTLAKKWMEDYLQDMFPQSSNTISEAQPLDDFTGFFNFSSSRVENTYLDELTRFLSEPIKPPTSLIACTYMKQAFIKTNTGVPSSASVERLFSFASDVFCPKRSCLSDNNFEMQLLLKMNKHVFK